MKAILRMCKYCSKEFKPHYKEKTICYLCEKLIHECIVNGEMECKGLWTKKEKERYFQVYINEERENYLIEAERKSKERRY